MGIRENREDGSVWVNGRMVTPPLGSPKGIYGLIRLIIELSVIGLVIYGAYSACYY